MKEFIGGILVQIEVWIE